MKIIYVYLVILFLFTILNCYTEFGFLFLIYSEKFWGLWIFLYTTIFPVKSMAVIFDKYKESSNFYKYSLFVFWTYLASVFLSGLSFVDFENFVILGDGATKYVMGMIYIACFISSFISFVFFQWRNRILQKKSSYEN